MLDVRFSNYKVALYVFLNWPSVIPLAQATLKQHFK